ncbi:MAG: DUF1638 domain-containing protein [Desulfobacterium sp.]
MHKKSKFLIICPVFEEELGILLPSHLDIVVHSLSYRIHGNPGIMKEELLTALSQAKKADAEPCILLGCECHCDTCIRDIAGDADAKYPLEKNCIEIILGPRKAKELQANRTAVFTQGWMNMVKELIEDRAWTTVDARMNFGYYDRLLLLEHEHSCFTDEQILEFYDLVQVPIETEKISLDYFQGVLSRLLGQTIPSAG